MISTIDRNQRVNIKALMQGLPVSGLAPQWLASITGLTEVSRDRRWQDTIWLLEPPAGQRDPYIEPVKALEILLRRQGAALEDAQARARQVVARMRRDVADERWVNFLDFFDPESPECLPVPDLVAWLRDEHRRAETGTPSLDAQGTHALRVPSEIVDFFEQAADVAATTPMFHGPENRTEQWSLEELLMSPPPKAMIEFVPGAPWADFEAWGEWKETDNEFLRWRERIRPVAIELERALGEPVYRFADLTSDIDDDDVHRFLVLHWCCSWKPDSAFVRYLLKISGARDVGELKAALIDPVHYAQPFKMNCSFVGLEAVTCRIDYLPPEAHKTVTVVFSTPQAREVAQALLAQKIDAHAVIVAPKELATDDWVRHATRRCRDWTAHYLHDRRLDNPIEILALTDELCVIADAQTPTSGFDLKLSDPVEDLLWLAIDLGVEATYFHVDRTRLWNPGDCLRKRGVPDRVAARQSRRAAFTRELTAIGLDNDFGSSGLWDDQGRNLR